MRLYNLGEEENINRGMLCVRACVCVCMYVCMYVYVCVCVCACVTAYDSFQCFKSGIDDIPFVFTGSVNEIISSF
jgi:hypothetical protein